VGLRFWARGNGVTVRFSASQPEVIPISDGGLCDTVEMACWNSHGIDLTLPEEWQQYTLLFSELESASASLGDTKQAEPDAEQFPASVPSKHDEEAAPKIVARDILCTLGHPYTASASFWGQTPESWR